MEDSDRKRFPRDIVKLVDDYVVLIEGSSQNPHNLQAVSLSSIINTVEAAVNEGLVDYDDGKKLISQVESYDSARFNEAHFKQKRTEAIYKINAILGKPQFQ